MNVILEMLAMLMWLVLEAAGVLGVVYFASEAYEMYRSDLGSLFRSNWLIIGTSLFALALGIITAFGAVLGISAIFGLL